MKNNRVANNENNLFPVFLKLEQMNLLIIGGGNIGLEKLQTVLKNSPATQITLVAPEIREEIYKLSLETETIRLKKKEFSAEDLEDADLVIAATGDKQLDAIIRQEAHKRKILVNVADTPDLCDFYLGSIVKKGDLKIAVSTNGKSPILARRIREFLEYVLPDDTQELMNNLYSIRGRIKGDLKQKIKKLNDITASLLSREDAL